MSVKLGTWTIFEGMNVYFRSSPGAHIGVLILHGLFERGCPDYVADSLPDWLITCEECCLIVPCLRSGAAWNTEHILALLEKTIQTHKPQKLRAFGYSMGGYALRDIMRMRPDIFERAAVVAAGDCLPPMLQGLLSCICVSIPPSYIEETAASCQTRLIARNQDMPVRTRVLAILGRFDPLLFGVRMHPLDRTIVYPYCGHRIWSMAWEDSRVVELLRGD